ncbi:beta-klotho [Lampris incognitus]|uniref:beta-klotho n=1 Tax=Lampris incognitus TaxID=2546036 RepID=UPI0024B5AB24|nr:beta-klotho [Lampris incognitus]
MSSSRSLPSLPCIFLLLLLLVCGWNKVACSLGEGRKLWQQPIPDPTIPSQSFLHDTFPPGFLWGTGTSAFQTEGAWDRDGKGSSIWDHYTHNGILATETADVASDSYVHWEADVEALEYLEVRSYSFSLSWPRLFPDGNARGQPNMAAVAHYSRLLDKLLEKRIEPIVTLYHWDLPQELQERYGGWKNDSMVGLFEDYAAFCFREYGSRVRHWLTMHNPYLVAVQGYGTGVHAPGEKGGPSGPLIVAHNLIRAHAKAWHAYNTNFQPVQKGKVSLVLGSHWIMPPNGQATSANVELCQQSMEAVLGWFANPIFGDGDYPDSMKAKHGALLPEFTSEEKLWVHKTADFFALSFGPNNLRLGRILVQYGQTVTLNLRNVLGWVKMEYGDQKVLLAEGGWFSESTVGREDTFAIYLMKRFINQVLQAIKLDGVEVFGYTAWSLVDGYEWNYGYTVRRGLFYIDFNEPNRTRIPKTTAQYYRQVIMDNGFPSDEITGEVKGHFPCEFHWGITDSPLQVNFRPFSPQFIDPHLYSWNLTGDGALHAVSGVKLQTRVAQCTDYMAIHRHLQLFASTGASHYHFALNWSLILPKGDLSVVNNEALRYYCCVLTELHKKGLKAVVTLYFPTNRSLFLGLPGPLHDSGGWLNQSTVEAFRQYAALCYRELGSWVRFWITVNEPNRLVDIYSSGKEQHQAAHNLLLAHAKAWRLYEKEYSGQQGALVSLALHADWAEPANPFLKSHTAAAQRFLLFELGRFLDPLLGNRFKQRKDNGDYPKEMKVYLQERARLMGLSGSPLPSFTEMESEEINGALDFIALNHFTTHLVSQYPHKQTSQSNNQHSQAPEHGCLFLSDPTWPTSDLGQALVPWGLRRVLSWVTERYGGTLPIIVTASGVDDQAPMEDRLRQHYLRTYLQEALKARQIDGVHLQGFYVWRLQDRHAPQFGLFTSPRHQSKPKASISAYREIINHSGFPADNSTQACKSRTLLESCSVCAWMFENKPLLVFGVCLLISAVMVGAVFISIIVKRQRNSGRGRRLNRRRKRIRAPMCIATPGVKCKP